jgi:hypothetical protein
MRLEAARELTTPRLRPRQFDADDHAAVAALGADAEACGSVPAGAGADSPTEPSLARPWPDRVRETLAYRHRG